MNMQAMLQQAQRMQKDIQTKQEQINTSEYTGTSEMVDITIYGSKKIKFVNIKVKSLDEEDTEVLEDMIKIAMNDAISKVEKDVESKLGSYSKQLGGLI
ncbi:MAG: YbaB/EbfC family nucleoid-associated protein [Bacilli bacterium]|nr:YbaB/EbfC family nucleoid-associated protein [Bacilli bacterium]